MSASRSTPRFLSAAVSLLLLASPAFAGFETDLVLSSSWSRYGEADGEFWSATCVDVAPDGTLWIGELRQPRIQHFTVDGTWLGAVTFSGGSIIDLDMAPDGWLYVVTGRDLEGNGDYAVIPVDPSGTPHPPLTFEGKSFLIAHVAATQTELYFAYGLSVSGQTAKISRFTRDGALLESRDLPHFVAPLSIAANDAGTVYTGGLVLGFPPNPYAWKAGFARIDVPSRTRRVQGLPDDPPVLGIGVDRTDLAYTFAAWQGAGNGAYGTTIHATTPEGGLAAALTRPTAGGAAEVLHDFAIHDGRIVAITSAVPIPYWFTPGADEQRIEIFYPAARTLLTALPDTAQTFTVDGKSYTGSAGFDWPVGTQHTFNVPSRMFTSPVYRRDFAGWSDSSSAGTTRSYTAGPVPDAVWPVYQDMYRVDITVEGPGTVTPNNDWFPGGTTLSLVATPDPCASFQEWAETGSQAPVRTIVVEGAVSDTARFLGSPFGADAGLALSASATDPAVHQDVPTGGIRNIYFWLSDLRADVCALEAQITGDMNVLAFVPEPNVFNVTPLPDLLMAIPSAPSGGPFLLGRFLVDDQGGSLCLDPSLGNGKLVVVDCATLNEWPASVYGFSSAGTPCVKDLSCGSSGGPDRVARGVLPSPQRLVLTAFPNPFRDATEIRLSPHTGRGAQLRIYDVQGRLVRTLQQEGRTGAGSVVSWDGRNGSGRSVGSGIYFLRLTDGDRTETRRVVRTR